MKHKPKGDTGNNVRGIFLFLSGLLLVSLIGLLFRKTKITVSDVDYTIKSVRLGWLFLISLSTVLHFNLSAIKWRVVLNRVVNQDPLPYTFFLMYTTLGAALGQVLPVQLSVITSRSLATRIQNNSFSSGFGSSFVEQVFDLLVPLALFFPGMIFVSKGAKDVSGWIGMAVFALVALGAMVFALVPRGVPALAAFFARRKDGSGIAARIAPFFYQYLWNEHQGRWFHGRVMLILYSLSILRFGNLILRTWFVTQSLHLGVPLATLTMIMPGIILSNLIAITPGNIGVTEWTFVGLLALVGVNASAASLFSLTHRVLVFISIIAAILLEGFVLGCLALWRRKESIFKIVETGSDVAKK